MDLPAKLVDQTPVEEPSQDQNARGRTGAVGPVNRGADDQHRSVSRHQDAGPLRFAVSPSLIEQGEAVGRQAVGRELGQIHRLAGFKIMDAAPDHRPIMAQEIHQVDLNALKTLEHQVLLDEILRRSRPA